MGLASLTGWELAGIPFILAAGILLHFLFEWSGSIRIIGVVAPVNESVCEHLKMVYWPALVYSYLEVACLNSVPTGYYLARATSIYVMMILLLGLFFVSIIALRNPKLVHRLIADALIFVAAVSLGQLSFCIFLQNLGPRISNPTIGVVLLALPAVGLTITTFYPPHISIFKDHFHQGYGIPRNR
jgi:hypothetical protein